MDVRLLQAAELIQKSSCVYALTGAGASVESGIPDFRSASGLWARFDPMEYGSIGAFRQAPLKVWEMLRELVAIIDAVPNAGHRAMAVMEERGWLQGIVTQNIDGLHQRAGSRNVVEFHGTVHRLVCLSCGKQYDIGEFRQDLPPSCPMCEAIMKPDVVFFDEPIPAEALQAASQVTKTAHVLIVAGTSCNVMPAAMIPVDVHRRGGRIIEVNPEPVLSGMADIVVDMPFAAAMQGMLAALEQLNGNRADD